MTTGYYYFPTVHNETVVFVCEDDLWTVPITGGVARRLTSNLGRISKPALSLDGQTLAFTGRDEGPPEVYMMPAEGGPATRLTFLGVDTEVVGWTPDGTAIVFSSNTAQPFDRLYQLYTIPISGGDPTQLPTGPAFSLSYGPQGGLVMGRNTTDLAFWKRYRGGLTGDLWIDNVGDGVWQRLIKLEGNVAMPLWIGDRVYFVSDHEGVGNLYSCLPDGTDLRAHTTHDDYYVRHPATDGQQIVYHAGADLYLFNPTTNKSQPIPITFHSPQVQRSRRFVDAQDYLEEYALHPQGHAVALVSRGKPFSMANWEQAVIQHGELNGVRYRLINWLPDGKRLVMVSDAVGEEVLELHFADASQNPQRISGLEVGRLITIEVSPIKNQLAITNHRHELHLIDIDQQTSVLLEQSHYNQILDVTWSPDGAWLAYSFYNSHQTSIIKLCQVETQTTYPATRTVLRDVCPSFDPDGKYLYFLSYRDFDPVYDNMHFDLNFPWGMRPYLITLQADLPSPFIPQPGPLDDKDDEIPPLPPELAAAVTQPDPNITTETPPPQPDPPQPKPIQIDLDGLTERVLAFPVPDGRYGQICGLRDKVIFTTFPIEGTLGEEYSMALGKGYLEAYDFEERENEILIEGLNEFDISADGKTLIYRAGSRLRVIKAGSKPDAYDFSANRRSGWLNLNRIRLSVQPQAEWEQMYREAWRLQRDYFWTENMSGLDWQTIYQRYLPLVKRVATRYEFSDLMWEMQGELGTSHAYEFGGDYRPAPSYDRGFLAIDVAYDKPTDSYTITHIVQGDVWREKSSSPLARPGVNVQVGDRLTAINGRKLHRHNSPGKMLVNQIYNELFLTIARDNPEQTFTISVKTLPLEEEARYREWVEANRQQVHSATNGRVGYVHIPDMGASGYAEFHRGYLAEVGREGLIVDVRFNSGGHVSQLIIEKLARRRLGYDVQRWGQPTPYPEESVMGPMVALCNEQTASDGDIFSHVFKLMNLGPLIGKRTWGGVVGIAVNEVLVDGGLTTQPEFSFWFKDVGWGVENYGTLPDIEVEFRPQDYIAGHDPQLARAIETIRQALQENPPELPTFGVPPRLGLPKLPRRTNQVKRSRK